MCWIDLVREYFPNTTNEEANDILWERTGFPCFWNIPQDGLTAEECCRKQLEQLKEGTNRTPRNVVGYAEL